MPCPTCQLLPSHLVQCIMWLVPLMRNPLEVLLVLGIRLDAQAGCEHELPDRRAEAGEEGVEGLLVFTRVSAFAALILLFSPLLPPHVYSGAS